MILQFKRPGCFQDAIDSRKRIAEEERKREIEERIATQTFLYEYHYFAGKALGSRRRSRHFFCHDCGFVIPPSEGQRGDEFGTHAPDCSVFWTIDVLADNTRMSGRNIDGWDTSYRASWQPCNLPLPEGVTLDAIPIWQLLNWDAVRGEVQK